MNTTDKISQAKAKLLVDYPYFGTLASRLELVVNDDIESFKSSGVKLEYREEYLRELELSEVEFILANGAMHSVLAHDMRKNNRSGWLWQMATDIAINDMLLQNGLDMPYGAQYRKRFAGMYAEEIYAQLKDDILREDENLEYEADDADDIERKDEQNKSQERTQEQLEEEILSEQLLAEEAISLLESKIKMGEAPEAIERFFDLGAFSKVDWREVLREAIDRYFRDDYVVMPPSKKLLYKGIYLPSNTSQTFRLVIAIDSSSSVDEALLNLFLSEVSFIMEQVQNYVIDIIVCDDTIHSHNIFYSGEALDVQLKGGGGTDFRPLFEFVEANFDDLKLLLYFTDLEGNFPKEVPNYSVKWITSKERETPFGELIVLED
ncbi:vWA domain-containing protein [Sulfurimonas indica]|uniref:vWA domain-containing protein n=1 Tax=Sulfurimonas indica TaxID=2508707 RepID=UPI001FE9016E|nr:VWA-like domain-containing protein [Sulfurimonas indica]